MRKTIRRFLVYLILAGLAGAGTFKAGSADSNSKPEANEKSTLSKPHALPFRGKVATVDKTKKTITLSGEKARVVQITSHTRITKAGKRATFDDATVGEEVAGAAIHSADGKMEATSLRIGPKPDTTAKAKQKPPEKTEKLPQ